MMIHKIIIHSKTFFISRNDKTAHFVGRSRLKELDIDDFYKRKCMNEEMEAELTEMDSIPDHLAVSEDKIVDKAVPIDIRKEQKTKIYKEKMSQDIKNIDTYENRTKVNTTKWRPIYEVIDEAYIEESNIFPGGFIRECKYSSNKGQFIPREVKNIIKRMVMEQSLYSQVIRIRRKDLKFVATDKKKLKLNLSFKVNLQDHNYGLILT